MNAQIFFIKAACPVCSLLHSELINHVPQNPHPGYVTAFSLRIWTFHHLDITISCQVVQHYA